MGSGLGGAIAGINAWQAVPATSDPLAARLPLCEAGWDALDKLTMTG